MVLSYRHGFHAGNFADVVKHSAQALLLHHFHLKPTPFYYLDTHAGGAIYNLRADVAAQKTKEYQAGIARVWSRRDYPREMEPYLACLRALNKIPMHTLATSAPTASAASPSASSISYAHEPPPAAAAAAAGVGAAASPSRRVVDYSWSHLLHSHRFTPTFASPLPHFAGGLPDAAFDPATLELYPGSSLLAAYFARQPGLREGGRTVVEPIADRAVLCELHKNEFDTLKAFYDLAASTPTHAADTTNIDAAPDAAAPAAAVASTPAAPHILPQSVRSRIHCMHQSGFLGLASTNSNVFLAPAQGRGLILIDPPYESEDEMNQLLAVLPKAYNRFRQGVYAIWYPIIDYSPGSPQKLPVDRLKAQLRAMGIPKMLCVEFDMRESITALKLGLSPAAVSAAAHRLPLLDAASTFNPDRQRGLGMVGTGMIIINPNHAFEGQMRQVCEFLSGVLPQPAKVEGEAELQTYRAKYSIDWITPEQVGAKKAVQVVEAPVQLKMKKAKTPGKKKTPTTPTTPTANSSAGEGFGAIEKA